MVFKNVRRIIANHLRIKNLESITLETTLYDDLDADSLDAVEIVMSLEDTFSIEIPDDDAEKFKKVGDIVSFIEKQK